jgi:hypothetical protein
MKPIVVAIVVAAALTMALSPMSAPAQTAAVNTPSGSAPAKGAPSKAAAGVGELVPSEDAVLKDFHSLGLINGKVDIFRAACPVRDIAGAMSTTQPTDADLAAARARMQRMFDLGIRTDISFQSAVGDESKADDSTRAIYLERAAANLVGIKFINDPMANSGPNSIETMTDAQVLAVLETESAKILACANDGGVVFHCSAGHDRTGIVAAFIRMKYEHWPVDQAIDEMRRLGHNWVKMSSNGGVSSWHEDHLKAIAKMLDTSAKGN